MTVSFSDLIPELAEWKRVEESMSIAGSVASATSSIFGNIEFLWPTFVENDGCVFRQGFSEQAYEDFMEATGGNRMAVEAVMNHVHISELFGDPALVPSCPQILYTGRKLKDIWSCKLSRDFPGRSFTVSFPEEPKHDLLDYEITFFQESGSCHSIVITSPWPSSTQSRSTARRTSRFPRRY